MGTLPTTDRITIEVAMSCLDTIVRLSRKPAWFREILNLNHYKDQPLTPTATLAKLERLTLQETPEQYQARRGAVASARRAAARTWNDRGLNLDEIATELGISTRQVRRYLK